MPAILSFKPKVVSKTLISGLNERGRDIILQRYGIGDNPERKTLEEIGDSYDITRERVRQLVNYALNLIKKGPAFSSVQPSFDEMQDFMRKRGGILSEREIFEHLAKDEMEANHIHFLLVLGEPFVKFREDEEFRHRWSVDEERSKLIHQILSRTHSEIGEEDLLSDREIVILVQKIAEELLKEKIQEEIILSWLNMSKLVDKNALGEWGKITSENIRPRGMRDLAFLTFKKHQKPMHFNDLAGAISDLFSKKAHPATVHNEVIKDPRFVLVGRGVYALKDWGYSPGTVSNVIENILQDAGPLTRDEIIKKVLKERLVKENTILVNLQNTKNFRRNPDGKYIAV